MEIVDISKFYRFQSLPNPIIFSSNILDLHSQTKDVNDYTPIQNLQYTNQNHTKDLNKFDNILNKFILRKEKKGNEKVSRSIYKNQVKNLLNKTKIYLIIKEQSLDSQKNEQSFLIPINNLENLSNKAISRLYLHRDGLFEINANSSSYISEDRPTNQRFYIIDDLLITEGIFDSQIEINIRNVPIETDDDILEKKGLKGKLLGDNPKFYTDQNYEGKLYLPEIDPDPEIWRDEDKDSIWVKKYGIPRQDYEYDEAEMDNSFFNNPIKYSSNTEKNIFPVFERLEEAEKFLLTLFEDILEPYRRKRISINRQDFLKLTKKEQYFLILPSSYILRINNGSLYNPTDLDYLDDPDQYISPFTNLPKSYMQRVKNSFAKKRWIKSSNRINSHYISENYDHMAYVTSSNIVLIDFLANTKIIEMGLGDFMEIWSNRNVLKREVITQSIVNQIKPVNILKRLKTPEIKGEILFVPNLADLQYTWQQKKNLRSTNSNLAKKFSSHHQVFQKKLINSYEKKFTFSYEIGKVMSLEEIADFLKKKN